MITSSWGSELEEKLLNGETQSGERMKILTAAQMRAVDRLTVERCGIPWMILMESAGAQVVNSMVDQMAHRPICPPKGSQRFLIVCGKGNNGGDGAVVARQLYFRSQERIDLLLVSSLEELRGEARGNMEIVRSLAVLDDRISFHEGIPTAWPASVPGDVVVIDALFGTGLTRPVEGEAARAIGLINQLRQQGAYVVAVDIPSGIQSDSGMTMEPYVRADLTVTMTAPKPGNILAPAAEANGRLVVASIGTPAGLVEEVVSGTCGDGGGEMELVEISVVRRWLCTLERSSDTHKGAVGNVLLIAGSPGRTGAAALTAGAVLRAGAGLVTVATPASALPLLVSQADAEVMTLPLSETTPGAISEQSWEELVPLLGVSDIIAVGPGIRSNEPAARNFIRRVVENRRQPVIIDADGLNAIAPWPEDLHGTTVHPIIVTPHPGEMARLTGRRTAEIQADRVGAARDLARRQGIIVVLKGSRTVIADPSGRVYINPTGNPGMATAGSGDVLTGLLAGLLAQRPDPAIQGVVAGVWLHGLAGDLAAGQYGPRSVIASEIGEMIGAAMCAIEQPDSWKELDHLLASGLPGHLTI